MIRSSFFAVLLAMGCHASAPHATASDAAAPDARPPDAPPDAPTCPPPTVVARCKDGFCALPAGCLVMGSPASDPCRVDIPGGNEETIHDVTLTHAFEIGEKEVTVAEFRSLMGYDPSTGQAWDEAAAYCNALSVAKGLDACYTCTGTGKDIDCSGQLPKALYACDGYRLPTEAEWEYAYRAATSTSSYAGDIASCTGLDPSADAIGWYAGNAAGAKHAGGQKQPNGFGLYDMAGNLAEWCHDVFVGDLGHAPVTDPTGPDQGDQRVVRGGSFDLAPGNLRASSRVSSDRAYDLDRGLRCARRL